MGVEISESVSAERLAGVARVIVRNIWQRPGRGNGHGQHDDFEIRMNRFQSAHAFNAGHARHINIHEHHLREVKRNARQRGLTGMKISDAPAAFGNILS